LGKPVALARRYYDEGADEITFLNITSFRQGVLDDLPMLQVLEQASEQVFVPLTVGGGIRGYVEPSKGEGGKEGGRAWSALEVAARYFRAGADKVSIGSDAVTAAEEMIQRGEKTGTSAIEQISTRYGRQAVVVSIDPRRVYLPGPEACPAGHTPLELSEPSGPNGETWCWYQATIKGGREGRPIDAVRLAHACQELGAGEILLNCVDMDGQCRGFDLVLVRAVRAAVTIPVIASSGAGKPQHFSEVFNKTGVEAALAAGIFHRREVEIDAVKRHLKEVGIPVRLAMASPGPM
jgi:glutamine amidotransferase/cyclase